MVKLFYGIDVLDGLKQVEYESVNCVVTSPPYFRQRDYKVKGQIGLEKTPEEYINRLVAVFQAVRRTMRDDATLWLNIGDSYASNGSGGHGATGGRDKSTLAGKLPPLGNAPTKKQAISGLHPKNLMMIPAQLALALQADGWILRSDIIWFKPNPMPESCTDRPTKAHEYIFLFSKKPIYFYNSDAIRTISKGPTKKMPDGWDTGSGGHGSFHRDGREKGAQMKDLPETQKNIRKFRDKQRGHSRRHAGFNDRWDMMTGEEQAANGANARSVWEIATQAYTGHFATFPKEVAKRCILAGSPAGGVVLDPFSGSGTTGEVALGLGRKYIGIDLNKKYLELARQRIGIFACV